MDILQISQEEGERAPRDAAFPALELPVTQWGGDDRPSLPKRAVLATPELAAGAIGAVERERRRLPCLHAGAEPAQLLGWRLLGMGAVNEIEPTTRLPCRRSWVRIPSSASPDQAVS